MAGPLLFLTYREVSRFLFLSFLLLAFVSLALWRMAYRLAHHLRIFRNGRERRVRAGRLYVPAVTITGARPLGR